MAELLAPAEGDRSTLEQARNLLAKVIAAERAGEDQVGRGHRLLDDAVMGTASPRHD